MMNNTVWVITGVSSGIGAALAKEVSEQVGADVIGISRRALTDDTSITHIQADLSSQEGVEDCWHVTQSLLQDYDEIIWVNNAGQIGEISYMGKLNGDNISSVMFLNSTAPALFMNKLLAHVKQNPAQKLWIMNISSGASKRAISSWATYCASKAALNMYTDCIKEELIQQGLEERIFIAAIAPGVVDTEMQEHIRAASPTDFSDHEKFVQLKEEQLLWSPEKVSHSLIRLQKNKSEWKNNTYLDVRNF